MKKNNILAITLLGGFVLLAAGCVKEADMNEKYRPEGTPIIFSAATGYENGDGTRTEYSGHFFNGSTEVTGNTLSSYANTWERIDWVQDDPMVIYYDRASSSANYNVTSSISPTAEISDAGIEVASGSTKLTWAGGSGNHIFTAMYPKNGFGNNNTITFNGATGQVGGLIPATQTLRSVNGKYLPQMQYAYMVARKTIDGTSTQHTVALPFKPAFTAFEFRLRRPATLGNGSTASFKVKSFTISSTSPLAGNFNLTIDGEDSRGATWSATPTVTNNGNKSNSVTVTFNGNTGVDLSTSADLDFTLLTLPTPIADLTLTLTFADTGNTTKTITLKDSNNQPKSFAPCKKYIITNSNAGFDDWEYIVEPIADMVTYGHETVSAGFEVRSYKQSKADPSIKVAVPWKIQYTTDNGTNWHDMTTSGYNNTSMATSVFKIRNSGNTADGFTGVGSIPGTSTEARSSRIEGTHNVHDTYNEGAAAATRAKLASAAQRGDPVGTGNGPFDLSKHPSFATSSVTLSTEVAQTTANSYIVSAPGYYMFPCVYGNAITDGSYNVSAYDPAHADSSPYSVTGQSFSYLDGVQTYKNTDSAKKVFYTPGFYNAINEYIYDPWILTDLQHYDANASFANAVVVWQDTHPHDEIIPYPENNATPTNIGLTTVNGEYYIWFYIDKEDIKPGNIMIALRGSVPNYQLTGNKNILWSWQIWVTEKNLTPDSTRDVLNGYELMPYNLGWVDTEDGGVEKFVDRELQYRIIQVENNVELTGSDNIEEFKMTQIGDSRETYNSIGGNPYYQWGRKDPFLSALPDGTPTSRPVSPGDDYTAVVTATGAVIPAEGIQSTILDYGKGITHPYIPYINNQATHTSTAWVGGPVLPAEAVPDNNHYRLLKIDRGPYNGIEAGWLNSWGVTDPMYWNMNTPSAGFHTYRSDGPYNTLVDATTCWNMWNYLPVHFSASDFCQVYPASLRSKTSCPYNLWNSYLYDQDAPDGDVNKFKTVYDPCPPGFTVPVRHIFIGTKTVTNDATWNNSINKQIVPVVTPANRTSEGATFGSSFFPYTGGRIFHGTELRVEEVAHVGLYWLDCAFTTDIDRYRWPTNTGIDVTNIAYYTMYHSALSFTFGPSDYWVQAYTRGTALSMRPMRDPKYTPSPVAP